MANVYLLRLDEVQKGWYVGLKARPGSVVSHLVVVGLEDARVGLVVINEFLLTCNLLEISTHEHAPGLVLNLENNTLLIRLVTILSLVKYLVKFHADPCNKSYICYSMDRSDIRDIFHDITQGRVLNI